MKTEVDLEKEYGEGMRVLAAEAGFLGMFETSTLREFLEKLSEKRDKTKEDEDVIEVLKAMIKYRGEE